MEPLKKIAETYLASGLCILPAIAKDKRPSIPWKKYATGSQLLTKEVVDRLDWNDSLCVVCGAPSGNLTILDFDCSGYLYDYWRKKVFDNGGYDLLSRLVIERSPSGGYHVAFRLDGDAVAGNQKIAYCKQFGAIAIETRGQGGICLIAPSPGYKTIQNDFTKVPVLLLKDYNLLLQCAQELDESEEPKKKNRVRYRR